MVPPMMGETETKKAQALGIRVWLACLATQELLCIYLGIKLGLYRALQGGAATAGELSARAGIAPRYAREWLEQQAAAGLLSANGDGLFSLPPGHAEVLCESDSPLSRVASVLPLGGVAGAMPELLAAYRSGAGLPDAAFGADWRDGHAAANRALFLHQLAPWIREFLPEVHRRLHRPGARVADVACGGGWAGIGLARAYRGAAVHGLDMDPAMIELARQNAAAAGVGDRVTFEARDGGDPTLAGSYDLVCLFDALHELPRPVAVLRACAALRAPGAGVLLMDARVGDRFTAPADEIERFQYTTSVLHCLPACLAEQPSAETGTVMRASQVRAFAAEAGFTRVELLPADDRFHRLYWLV
jgi:2-polyprenyl-3-methyl-5-hydroxy-6-metoxy-1,4-benzoquinol methylase